MKEPFEMECPQCGCIITADYVDNGVGNERCGPYACEACGWVEEQIDFLPGIDVFYRER